MIYLYTDYENLVEKSVTNQRDFFGAMTMSYGFDEIDLKYMKEIDGAVIIDDKTFKIETPFGIGALTDISTGLMTLLNIRYINKVKSNLLVNTISCGDNIFPYIVKESKNNDIRLLYPLDSVICKDKADIIVNDKYRVESFSELRNLEV